MSTQPRGYLKPLDICNTGDITVINFIGRKILNDCVVESMGKQLSAVFDSGTKKVIVDLRGVDYMSSFALAKLIVLNKNISDTGGTLILCGESPIIYESLNILRLDKGFFNIKKDKQEALSFLETINC